MKSVLPLSFGLPYRSRFGRLHKQTECMTDLSQFQAVCIIYGRLLRHCQLSYAS